MTFWSKRDKEAEPLPPNVHDAKPETIEKNKKEWAQTISAVPTPEAEAELADQEADKPRFYLAAERMARELGTTPENLLGEYAQRLLESRYPTPDCLRPDEVQQFAEQGSLSQSQEKHVSTCAECTSLLSSIKPPDTSLRALAEAVRQDFARSISAVEGEFRPPGTTKRAKATKAPQLIKEPAVVSLRTTIPWLFKPAVLAGVSVLLLLAIGTIGAIGTKIYLRQFGTLLNPHVESVAVLPIQDLSGGERGKYLAYGMTEGLIADLGSTESLKVIGSRSVMQIQTRNEEPTEIARKLNVDAVVETSMQQRGDELVLSTRLIRASTNQNLWSRTYEANFDQALKLQNDVARNVATVARVKLTSDGKERSATTTTVPPPVLALYMEGRYLLSKRDQKDMQASLAAFQKIVADEPRFALGWASLADSYSLLALHGHMPSKEAEAYQHARESANKAIALDPDLAEGHAALALSDFYNEWNWAEAEKEFRKAWALNPNYADAHHWYGLLLSALKRHDEAIHELKRAVELEPLFPPFSTDLANGYFVAHQYDLAIKQYQKTLADHPNNADAQQNLASFYVETGKCQKALSILKDLDLEQVAGDLAATYARCNEAPEARKLLPILKDPFEIGVLYAALGERDRAFDWLQKACEQRSYLSFQIPIDPALDSLRSDPRYQELLRCIHYPS